MSSQLPPPPKGRRTGFPYSILWEEFGQIWERLDEAHGVEETYEKLLADAKSRKPSSNKEPVATAIRDMIRPLKLSPAAADDLTARLYRIAAAYRIPHLRKALGLGATKSRKRLSKLAAASATLTKLLQDTPLEQEVALGFLRAHVDPAESMVFHFKMLVKEIGDLAKTAEIMADEMPQMPRGSSADVLQARLMEAATRVIGAAAGSDYLEVLQADSAGRNPRAKSKSAHVLFAYLKLVEPRMTNATKVRLFAGHNYGPRSVSLAEVDELPPKRWPHHAAREKLTR